MNPHSEHLKGQHEKAAALLQAGISPREVATLVGLSLRAIYALAARERLPTNPTIKERGKAEGKIIYMHLAGYEPAVIGKRFKLAEKKVEEILERVRDRANEESLDGPG